MIRVEILSDLNGAPLGRTQHDEPTAKAAQEWAAHWTHEMISGGFVPEGAVLTYVISEVPIFFEVAKVIDVVSYLHSDQDITIQ